MLKLLLIIAALVWVPIALGLFKKRPLTVLLVWIVIGPVVTNIVRWPGANPFFWSSGSERIAQGYYLTEATSITVKEIFEPTRVVALMMLGVFVLNRVFRKKRSTRMDSAEWRMVFFSGWVIASALLFSNRVAFGLRIGLDVFIVPFLAYFLMRRLSQHEEDLRKLTRVIGYLGLYVILACVLERLINTPLLYRLKGPFVQGAARGSSILHIVLIVIFFAALLEVVRSRRDPDQRPVLKRELRWFLILGSPVMIALTWARGNWTGLFLALWFFLLLGRPLVRQSSRMVVVGLMLVIIPLALVVSQAVVPSSLVEERIGEMDNVLGRLETWRIAFRQGLEDPITGIGLNNTRDLLAQARTSIQEESGTGFTYTTVHNSFLTFFSELGIIGLLLYISIVAALMRTGWRLYRHGRDTTLRWRGVAVIAILIGYLAPGFFANTLQMFGFGHFLVFGFLGGLIGVSYKPENLVTADEVLPISAHDEIAAEPAMVRMAQLRRDKFRTVRW